MIRVIGSVIDVIDRTFLRLKRLVPFHAADSEQHPNVDSHAYEAGDRSGNRHLGSAINQVFEHGDEQPKLQDEKHQIEKQERRKDDRSLLMAIAGHAVHASEDSTPTAKI